MFVVFKLYQTKLIMFIYFNNTNNITKKYNLNSYLLNDNDNNHYYRKKLFKGIIEIIKKTA